MNIRHKEAIIKNGRCTAQKIHKHRIRCKRPAATNELKCDEHLQMVNKKWGRN